MSGCRDVIASEPVELVGTVVRGDQRDRTIGFPTANLVPEPNAAVPARGVYAGLANGAPAAINIGFRPTIAGTAPGLLIEVHVLDYSGDLYGQSDARTFSASLAGRKAVRQCGCAGGTTRARRARRSRRVTRDRSSARLKHRIRQRGSDRRVP
jgi:hypothetical protein